MIQLAAFLGNPGAEYARNRHNAGRMLAQALPFYTSLGWQKKYKSLYAATDSARLLSAAPPSGETEPSDLPDKIHFLMPETYMNLSGESVLAAASFFKIKSESILVVHDELELPLGTLSLKFSGGLGGHNGLRSMKACFGNADFWRLRIGIGRPGDRLPGEGGPPGSGKGVSDWVLSDFSGAEMEQLAPVLDAALVLFLSALTGNPEKLLPQWAKKKIAA
ncbi:MAG: aminoacyl-tRNA hydrolase [Treponema sp.]|jgi:PTH1 family peptidyl-tRNA hydrolase|nr:aminoacyl-tRNA hydrolase [Treponema sp.]